VLRDDGCRQRIWWLISLRDMPHNRSRQNENVHGFGAAMLATAIWNIRNISAAISMIRRVDG
jgi:hypothetical protein